MLGVCYVACTADNEKMSMTSMSIVNTCSIKTYPIWTMIAVWQKYKTLQIDTQIALTN